MRRHHFLNLQSLEPQGTSGTDGGETIRERRRSSQVSTASGGDSLPKQLPLFLSGSVPGQSNDEESSEGSTEPEAEPDEAEPGFLGRVTSYSRLMHAHTQSQLDSPSTGPLPAYSKSMHAFTMNQMHSHHSKSETSSPHIGSKLAIMPSKVGNALKALNFDELPQGPSNTPEIDKKLEPDQVSEPPVGRRRSLTDPSVVRDFAMVKDRDLANVRPAAV